MDVICAFGLPINLANLSRVQGLALGLSCLELISTIFQLYHGGHLFDITE